MKGKPIYKDRYPGLLPFDKGQSTIFFGRDKEKKELFYLIALEKIVLLFGKSGLGKSSILNAGVSPLLEHNGYLPIRVRFTSVTQERRAGENENLLIRDIKILLHENAYTEHILYNKENPKLWEFIKATQFNELIEKTTNPELYSWVTAKREENRERNIKSDEPPVIPVFIFDQFEEFFTHPIKHQEEFLCQLAEVVHEETPRRILDWITSIEPEQRTPEQIKWHQQPNIKIVFAIRSDKLAKMQSIVPFIHTVLRNRYELKPLTPEQSALAIKEPAAMNDLGPEYTPPFTFDETTLSEIIAQLSGKSNEIESSQLQIVTNFIEQKVRKRITEADGDAIFKVNSNTINPQKDFPLILDNFYDSRLETIEDPNNRELARKLIEDALVIDGQRDSISKNKMNKFHGIGDDLIEEILNTRLVREETTSQGSIYELSHDTLIAPVEKSKNKRLHVLEVLRIEEEKLQLAQEAKRKDEELKEKQSQLIKEMQLRTEAEKQKKEVERLSKKLKNYGGFSFLFILMTFLIFIFIIINNNNTLRNENVELSYDNEGYFKDLTNTKQILLDVFQDQDLIVADSVKNDSLLNIVIDTVFNTELKQIQQNPKLLTKKQRIDSLNKIIKNKNYPDKGKRERLE